MKLIESPFAINSSVMSRHQLPSLINCCARTEYQIFKLSGGKISGTFKEIQPAIPGEGLTWDTSELYSAGKLKVAGSTVGIQSATSTASPLRVEYYSLSGQRITAPEKGICIMRTIMQDGSIISQKVGF